MDLSRESTREGVRGGREQFRWDSLQSQPHRDRQQYLGYSTKVGTVGKFGQFHTNDWWRKDSHPGESSDAPRSEKFDVERMKDDMLMRAIGVKPKPPSELKPQPSIDQTSAVSKKEEDHAPPDVRLKRTPAQARDEDEDVVASRQTSGLGFRKYLKPNDWSEEIVEVEEYLAPVNESIESQPRIKEEVKTEQPKRTFGPARPEALIKEEPAREMRRSPDRRAPDRHQYRSRSRDRNERPRDRRRSFSRDNNYRRRSRSYDRSARRGRY